MAHWTPTSTTKSLSVCLCRSLRGPLWQYLYVPFERKCICAKSSSCGFSQMEIEIIAWNNGREKNRDWGETCALTSNWLEAGWWRSKGAGREVGKETDNTGRRFRDNYTHSYHWLPHSASVSKPNVNKCIWRHLLNRDNTCRCRHQRKIKYCT